MNNRKVDSFNGWSDQLALLRSCIQQGKISVTSLVSRALVQQHIQVQQPIQVQQGHRLSLVGWLQEARSHLSGFQPGFCLLLTLGVMVVSVWAIAATPAWADDYNKEFLVGADFSGRVLTDSSFTKANLRGSNFANADLRGVSFFGANLEDANLEGANLSNTTLDTARFSGANLTNAILEGAFAFNAKFDGTTVTGADFTNVELRQDAQMLLCQTAAGTNPTTHRKTRDTLNCG